MADYLVTGACGFIGSHLAEALLADGHGVRIVDDLSSGKRENAPDGAELLIGDVADRDLMGRAMAGMDGCFHLAAIASVQRSNEEWLATHRANLTGTVAVFDAARELGGLPVVYASSAAVYGDNTVVPLTEDAATWPLTAYGADKLGCELHARVATLVHGLPTVGFRFFNVYGPRQDPHSPYSGVIAIFAERLARGAGISIFGDGGQYRDFVYVGDVLRYLLAAMARRSAEPEVFNVCTGRSTTILQLAEAIGEIVGRPPAIEFGPARAGDIYESLGDPGRLIAAFGFAAETELPEGLAVTLG
ncbi:MAG: NAD-dependent epimerase/dehydratase family protein [Alphaproteobacteria bacterium]|jgi:UDP-glucose 4-epimerase|nr:NAD-dependent epimerase/dehydratase family protein [Alphaproteobacteria bacterium]MDP6814172.1 NAD-dependent epimerase/dehydratase family protein [Alphaproteobacteria bacterium]